jgi:predicted GIY-YIG superfamily endonuclease
MSGDRGRMIYGFNDACGRLIYVGCTLDLEARETAHQRAAWWWPQVDRVRILATAPSKKEGIRVERQMIETLRPRWNQMHRLYHRQGWTADDYLDVILSRLVAPGFDIDPAHLKRYRALPEMVAEANSQFGLNLSLDMPRDLLSIAARELPIPPKYAEWLIAAEQVAA